MFVFPCERDVFARNFIEGLCNFGEARDERSVKVAKTQKRSDILNVHWSGPVFDALHFGWVHAFHPLFKD